MGGWTERKWQRIDVQGRPGGRNLALDEGDRT